MIKEYKSLTALNKLLDNYTFVSSAYIHKDSLFKVNPGKVVLSKGLNMLENGKVKETTDYYTVTGQLRNYETYHDGGTLDDPYLSLELQYFLVEMRKLVTKDSGNIMEETYNIREPRPAKVSLLGVEVEDNLLNSIQAWNFNLTITNPFKVEVVTLAKDFNLLILTCIDALGNELKSLYLKGANKVNRDLLVLLSTSDKVLGYKDVKLLIELTSDSLLPKPAILKVSHDTNHFGSITTGKFEGVEELSDSVYSFIFREQQVEFSLKGFIEARVLLAPDDENALIIHTKDHYKITLLY